MFSSVGGRGFGFGRGGGRGGSRGGFGGGGGEGSHAPSKVLFVRNLSYDTEPAALQEVFQNATDVFLPRDRDTGERRG